MNAWNSSRRDIELCKCGSGDKESLLIDATLRGMEREAKRFCYSRRPEAVHPFAGCLPQVIVVSAVCKEDKQPALAARRYMIAWATGTASRTMTPVSRRRRCAPPDFARHAEPLG
jgi:hypothetical protein